MNTILVLNGSNSAPEKSINWMLASRIASKFSRYEVDLIGLHDHPLPMYPIGLENDSLPEVVVRSWVRVKESAAIVIVSPKHNGVMPAFLKNAMNWLSRVREAGNSFSGAADKQLLLLSSLPGKMAGRQISGI